MACGKQDMSSSLEMVDHFKESEIEFIPVPVQSSAHRLFLLDQVSEATAQIENGTFVVSESDTSERCKCCESEKSIRVRNYDIQGFVFCPYCGRKLTRSE